MNTSMNWWVPFSEHGLLTLAIVLLAKITVLLAVAWCVHALLRRANPRWRVLLWRSTGSGMLLMVLLAACPPVWSWSVLPPETTPAETLARRVAQPSPELAVPVVLGVVHEDPAGASPVEDRLSAGSVWPVERVVEQQSHSSELSATGEPARSPPAEPAVAEAPGSSSDHAVVVLGSIGAVWLIGLVGLAGWTLIGLHRLKAIVGRSQPVPDWVWEQAERVKDTIGCKRFFVLRKTGEVATPCLVGIWPPVILLPEEQVDLARREELPAILLHETAHLKARDLPWNAVLHGLSILFWLHPLAWRIRLAHAGACETVADAVAADRVGDVAGYIRTLARLAVQMQSPALGSALAMARASIVMQRIAALQRKLFLGHLPRGRMILVVALGTIVVGLLGGVSLTRATAEPQASVAAAEDALPDPEEVTGAAGSETHPEQADEEDKIREQRQLVVHATAKDTGKPLAGVKVRFYGSIGEQKVEHVKLTDDRGRASLSWEAGAKVDYMRATWSKTGFVSQHYQWLPPVVYMYGNDPPVELPEELHLKFHRGNTVGGLVQDEEGLPIEGAQVAVIMVVDWPEGSSASFCAADRTTDAEGRWHWDEAPEDLGRVSTRVNCPGYLEGKSSTSKCVLKRGENVVGRVVNAAGDPIEGAAVRLGKDGAAPSKAILHSGQATQGDEEGTKANQILLDVTGIDVAESETSMQPPGTKVHFLGGGIGDQLVIHATAKDTGEPLVGVKIHFQGSLNRKAFEYDVVTSDEGTAGLHWPARSKFGGLFMSCQKDGFVPIRCLWRDHRAPDEQIPKQLDLQFETGKWIGGVVQDQGGRPIEGATVKVSTGVHRPRPALYWRNVAEIKTDGDGRWKWKGVPDDLSYYSVDIEHPDYVEGRNELRPGTEAIYVMKRSGRLTGRVVNEEGEPIELASVLLGYPHNMSGIPKTSTDADGRFVLENCPPGESIMTVDDGRHSPAQRKVVVGEQEDLGEFRLDPGHTIQVRVVNERGEPVEGAHFEVESWRNTDTLCCMYSTDAEGRIVWNGAPEDSVLCSVQATDYLEVTRHPLQASDEEHVITLLSELTIRGKVTDAQTGLPIPEFAVRRGFDVRFEQGIFWVPDEETRFTNGAYEFKIDQQSDEARLRVEVPGYHFAVSRTFKPDEGNVTYDFALEPGAEMTGTVFGPAGDPVAGAQVGLAREGSRAYLDAGSFHRMANRAEMATTDESGTFAFPPQSDEPFLLIVTHESGFAQLTREQFEKSSLIELAPWGRIEGQVLLGDKPDASCRVQYSPTLSDDEKKFFLGCYYWANADANGRFELDRVIPGSGSVERVIVTEYPGGVASNSSGWQQAVDVTAGETTTVTVGGGGRTVVGRFEFDRDPEATPKWVSYPLKIQLWDMDNDQAVEPTYQCQGTIDTAGGFEILDVRPGEYRVTRHITAVPADGQTRYIKLGEAKHDFTVPVGDEPLDLGMITVKSENEQE